MKLTKAEREALRALAEEARERDSWRRGSQAQRYFLQQRWEKLARAVEPLLDMVDALDESDVA